MAEQVDILAFDLMDLRAKHNALRQHVHLLLKDARDAINIERSDIALQRIESAIEVIGE